MLLRIEHGNHLVAIFDIHLVQTFLTMDSMKETENLEIDSMH